MLENVNIQSNVAIYTQIENHVKFAVASGRLKTGDRLPSVRELSEKLKVNVNTVAKCYRDLEIMGVVYTRWGMGFFISKDAEAKCAISCRQHVISRMHEVVAEAKAAGMSAQDVKTACAVSYAADGEIYGDTPAEVLALAKEKKH